MESSTILIVDDQPIERDVLEDALFGQDYTLVYACNGADGLQKASEVHPDLILLDGLLPDMSGYEVCRKLRSDANLTEVPILILTALDDPSSGLAGIEAGADDFLTKPFNQLELRARLKTYTRLARYRKLLNERANLEQAHNELLKAYDATIEGWSRAMDMRDADTEGHTRRVTELAERLARSIGLSEEEITHIHRGSLLHDLGKLGVPDGILLKPGTLNEVEWAIMKKHPQYAYEMLSPIAYLRPALDIPYCHHEHWDGSGYPRGLKGEEIPLAARIFALVDVWDSLTSDRPYRRAWPEETVYQYIRTQSGLYFDPRIAEAFLKMMKNEAQAGNQ